MECIGCNLQFTSNRINQHWCSYKCKCKNQRRIRSKLCSCGKHIHYESSQCRTCYMLQRAPIDDITLEEAIYVNCHKSSAFALVRTRARAIAKKLNWLSCRVCGYNKHIEISHIKPISSYELNTKISVVNAESNLVPLCPNHHWEFDHGLIPIERIALSSKL